MKINKLIAIALAFATVGFIACNEKNTPVGPGTNPNDNKTDTDTVAPQPSGEYEVITIAKAIEMINAEAAAWQSDKMYQLEGTLSELLTKAADVPGKYSNINFVLSDGTNSIKCYYTNNLENQPFTSADQIPNVGSKIVVVGYLKNYVNKNTNESTPEVLNGYIKEVVEAAPAPETHVVTLEEALQIIAGLGESVTTADTYEITCEVEKIITSAANVVQYGNVDLDVTDGKGNTLRVFRALNVGNVSFTSFDQVPPVGSKIVVFGQLQNYKGTTPELCNGYIKEIIEKGSGPADGGVKTIAEALAIIDALADGGETAEVYTVSGTVESVITTAENLEKYGNVDFWMQDADGNKLEGFRITDPDGAKVTALPEVGAAVTVKGTLMKYVKDGNVTPEIKGEFVK